MRYLIDTNVICETIKTTPNAKVINWFNNIDFISVSFINTFCSMNGLFYSFNFVTQLIDGLRGIYIPKMKVRC